MSDPDQGFRAADELPAGTPQRSAIRILTTATTTASFEKLAQQQGVDPGGGGPRQVVARITRASRRTDEGRLVARPMTRSGSGSTVGPDGWVGDGKEDACGGHSL